MAANLLVELLDDDDAVVTSGLFPLEVIIDGKELVMVAYCELCPGREVIIAGVRISAARHEKIVKVDRLRLYSRDSYVIRFRAETTHWSLDGVDKSVTNRWWKRL
jgi:hypothetical protein